MGILNNQQWETAAQVFIQTGNKTEAYRQAGYSTNMSDKAISTKVQRVFNNGAVLGRVAELQAEQAKLHAVTIESLTADLREDRALAYAVKNPSAAVSAVMGMARLHGLDKQVLTADLVNPPSLINIAIVDGSKARLTNG
jgi:phage terminase small subunit|tara:strand:- start:3671 stop:4090 length:420 start_codon:yes stop_codon:yes gene_type:complete